MTDWQPIETAPKDGKRILVWMTWHGGKAEIAAWNKDVYAKHPKPFWCPQSATWMGVKGARENQPRYWMPLPTEPKEPT